MMKIKKYLTKYKVISILLIFFLIIFFSLWSVVSGGYDKQNKVILFLKEFIPSKIARQVRDVVFLIPDLKERNRFLELVMQKHDQKFNGELFNEEIVISQKNNDKFLLKEFFLPFPRLDLRHGWASTKNALSKHYLEIVDDKVIAISGDGTTIYFNKNNINNERLNQIIIPNNINKILLKNNYENMGIRDLFFENKKIYISLYFKNKDGYSMNIYQADLNFKNLEFEALFKLNEFWEFFTVRTGGRIEKYKNNKILITTGDSNTIKSAQNPKSLFGKIISIDKDTGEHEIVSIGHRNPQGLLFLKNLDLIINTEHGPKGGDEINLNFQKNGNILNFGWDISSYGIKYNGEDPFYKSHEKYGFVEPFKYFTPSIGISELVSLDDEDTEDGNKYLFVSSLRAASIYVIKVNSKFDKILNEDRLYFSQRRIRDMKYDEENNSFLLLFETIPSIGVLKINP